MFQRFWFGAVAVELTSRKWPLPPVCAAIVSAIPSAIPSSLAWLTKKERASLTTSALYAETEMPRLIACFSAGATAFGSSAAIVIATGCSWIAFWIVLTWPAASAVAGPT